MAPKHRKPRTSRMDAAIDAMVPFGFTEGVVIDKMRELLKEYGGQAGYGFIELDAYRVLLESLLLDQEKANHKGNQEQVAVGEASKANEMIEAKKVEESHGFARTAGFIDIPVCSSTPPTIPPPPPLVTFRPPPPTVLDAVLPPPPPPVMSAAFPLPEIAQPRRRKPCYGWIDDDDDDDQKGRFITLPSASFNRPISPPEAPPPQPAQPELSGGRKNPLKRRSRWDLRPEDM